MSTALNQINQTTNIKNIAVIYGGFSEREVSLNSGRNISLTLNGIVSNDGRSDSKLYRVYPVEITTSCQWQLENIARLQEINKISTGFLTIAQMDAVPNGGEFINILDTATGSNWFKDNQIDLAYLALHGGWGENGGIQSFLDYLGVKYTGSGAGATALCMDKLKTQEIVSYNMAQSNTKNNLKNNIKVPQTICVDFSSQTIDDVDTLIQKNIGYPVFAKPRDGGSSFGNRLVSQKNDLLGLEGVYLLQEVVLGKEITVPVLGGLAMPIVEIISDNNFDYFDKYLSAQTQEICPANISFEFTNQIQTIAQNIHTWLGCEGLSRSDFMISIKDGTETIYYLETNTTPGCTASSLCPKSAKAMSMTMAQFLEKQIYNKNS